MADYISKLSAYEGCRVLIIGAGKSGMAAARLLSPVADKIVVSDAKVAEELGAIPYNIADLGGSFVGGTQDESLLEGVDFVVRSPGVPWEIPVLSAARGKGYEIIGELELAYRVLPSDSIIAVTGSNGKSTTTALIGAMFEEAKIPHVVAGNIGRALSDAIVEVERDTVVILEVSSFQLEDTVRFRPKVGVILNLSADHLDHHGSEEEYFNKKWRLFEGQSDDDWAVLNGAEPQVYKGRHRITGKILIFNGFDRSEQGVRKEAERLVYNFRGNEGTILPVKEVKLPGKHNLENAMAASICAIAMGVSPTPIAAALRSFPGLPHRLELIERVNKVDFINDSKATNVASAVVGISSFSKPVVLIAGGKHKGGSFEDLAKAVKQHCKAVVVYGEAAGLIADEIGDEVPVERCETIKEAVGKAKSLAKAKDIVLLSPACTSWDQYGSFEERGDDFRKAVMGLK
ncbi:MAG: UDP-N-acetylmuramoyl-L-alanine--D-glutamate ligase [bacterium]|nr:UDP-N-acetylmuramoyl-L-alanine--D-glutamate ligase [bacterium]